jgi:signal transduction histidine kinase
MKGRDIRSDQELLSEFAHAVKTPLLSIKMALDLMESSIPSRGGGDIRNKIKTARENAEYVSELLCRFLELCRMESGEPSFHGRQIDAREEIKRIVEDQRLNFEGRGVNLRFSCIPANFSFPADPVLLYQALINLLENSLKFTSAGGTVKVNVFRKDAHVHICVSDTGKGIAPEHREKIFEKYFQVRDTEGKKYSSVGLGLAIAQKIAEIHNGSITMSSRPGKGSKFTIILPMCAARSVPVNGG